MSIIVGCKNNAFIRNLEFHKNIKEKYLFTSEVFIDKLLINK